MIASTFRAPPGAMPASRHWPFLVFLACLFLFLPLPDATAQRFETRVAHAFLIDANTGTVLFEKDADTRMPPASLAKLMTMAVVFDAIREGRLRLDDEFQVSETAWRQGGAGSGGSTMFAKLGSTIKLEDLIRGVVIQSGNDACIVIAEGMAGTEAAFADLMNAEAQKIGLTGSHFRNATGLPDPEQYVTAHDLARVAEYIIDEFPEFYKIYGETEFTWNKIRQLNRNPLLAMNIGADGMKTGFTDESGYGLVGSALRDGQRLILVINGAETDKARAEEARKLIDWGFRAFERVQLFDKGEIIAEARVFGGAEGRVGLVSKGPLDLLLPVGSRDMIKAEVIYDGPVPAPVEAGQAVGIVKFTTTEGMRMEAPVFAATDIGVGSLQQRAMDGLEELLLGWW
jgi:D-alanyl-D-alanine carboxypeptidase (penicillin-binding protein 5/6)